MSAAETQSATRRLDAGQVLAEARAAAARGDSAARSLDLVCRLCFVERGSSDDSENWAGAELQAACDEVSASLALHGSVPARVLYLMLFYRLGDVLREISEPGSAELRLFLAIHRAAAWLSAAARLEARDGRAMRRPGGLRLTPDVFDGARLRAQVVAVPGGDVLRLTWEDTARLAVQSLPGRFAELDPAAEPE